MLLNDSFSGLNGSPRLNSLINLVFYVWFGLISLIRFNQTSQNLPDIYLNYFDFYIWLGLISLILGRVIYILIFISRIIKRFCVCIEF